MFTGIVECIGRIQSIQLGKKGSASTLQIKMPRYAQTLKIGSSLAVNGVCLTVVKKSKNHVFFNLLNETKNVTTFKFLKSGQRVNLERPLRWNGRLSGHFVLGHVEAIGRVRRVEKKGAEKSFLIEFPKKFKVTVVEKGSTAVDGVSLTLGKVRQSRFWVHCVPHTLKATILSDYQVGTRVNLEADILEKFKLH